MRFACLHVPGFALQVHARTTPGLKDAAFAVLSEGEREIPRITACSRRARDAGLRPGLTATQARAVAADVTLVDAAPRAYAQAMQALGEAALALSVTVDIQTMGRVFARVPPGKAAPWADKLVTAAARVGFQARVGVADDRFTAWAATQALPRQRARVVPAGGSAAFLAPLPLELLPLDDDVRRMLTLLGIKTVGDFAALPSPSVGRRFAQASTDAQALARGQDRTPLVAYLPTEPVCEALELETAVTELEPLAFVIRPLAERVLARLSGRGAAVARLALRLSGEGRRTEVVVAPTQPTTSARAIADLSRAHLAERTLEHPVTSIELAVLEEGEAVAGSLDLFPRAHDTVDVAAVDVAVARLRAAFGPESVHAARLVDRHRPESAFEKVPFSIAPPPRRRRKEPPRVIPIVARGGTEALRLIEPPASVEADGVVEGEDPPRPPRAVAIGGKRRRVAAARGPTRLEGEWWTDEPIARDYFEVETDDGGRYWLYRDHADGRFYLHGVFD
jgi:protein ImuB